MSGSEKNRVSARFVKNTALTAIVAAMPGLAAGKSILQTLKLMGVAVGTANGISIIINDFSPIVSSVKLRWYYKVTMTDPNNTAQNMCEGYQDVAYRKLSDGGNNVVYDLDSMSYSKDSDVISQGCNAAKNKAESVYMSKYVNKTDPNIKLPVSL